MNWKKRHEDALKGHFRNRQGRTEVPWPDIPSDFEGWEPQKRNHQKRFLRILGVRKVSTFVQH